VSRMDQKSFLGLSFQKLLTVARPSSLTPSILLRYVKLVNCSVLPIRICFAVKCIVIHLEWNNLLTVLTDGMLRYSFKLFFYCWLLLAVFMTCYHTILHVIRQWLMCYHEIIWPLYINLIINLWHQHGLLTHNVRDEYWSSKQEVFSLLQTDVKT
jgi:hypothetical protein